MLWYCHICNRDRGGGEVRKLPARTKKEGALGQRENDPRGMKDNGRHKAFTPVQEKRHIPQEMTMLQPKGFSSTARAIHADIPVWVRFGRSLIARNDTQETVKPTQTKIGASSAGPFARRSITINRVLRDVIVPAKLCWPEH